MATVLGVVCQLCKMFSNTMKINEKNVSSFASSNSPVDKEGYLSKRNEVKGYQRRWFVLKGNLLFYYEKKQDKEPMGLIVLESCSVQASATEKHGFEVSFDGPGTRTFVMTADNDEEMQSWMRAVSHASYEFLRTIVNDLQKQVDSLTSQRSPQKIPLVPKPKTKVENGVLVDVDSAPPIPPKKKSVNLSDSTEQPVVPAPPLHPHSNPIVLSTSSTRETLSPPGTLDRTPVLLPQVMDTSTSEEEEDKDRTQPFIDRPFPYSTSVVLNTALREPQDKDVYSIHGQFMEACQSVDKTGPPT